MVGTNHPSSNSALIAQLMNLYNLNLVLLIADHKSALVNKCLPDKSHMLQHHQRYKVNYFQQEHYLIY